MNEFLVGQKCRYAGIVVTVRSVCAPDGRYVVEDSEGAFFHAKHDQLKSVEDAKGNPDAGKRS